MGKVNSKKWNLNLAESKQLIADWQRWTQNTPTQISCFLKGKSDFLSGGLSAQGISVLLDHLARIPENNVVLIFEPYGGTIAKTSSADTAFAHRESNLISIQYFSIWGTQNERSREQLSQIRGMQEALAPYVNGKRYVNYCDLDHPRLGQGILG